MASSNVKLIKDIVTFNYDYILLRSIIVNSKSINEVRFLIY